jgi:hypothetical protein
LEELSILDRCRHYGLFIVYLINFLHLVCN